MNVTSYVVGAFLASCFLTGCATKTTAGSHHHLEEHHSAPPPPAYTRPGGTIYFN